MSDLIFVKYTTHIAGCPNSFFGSYFLGALFLIERNHFFGNGEVIHRCVIVLDCNSGGVTYCGTVFTVHKDEISLVDNDKDLNKCLELSCEISNAIIDDYLNRYINVM